MCARKQVREDTHVYTYVSYKSSLISRTSISVASRRR